MKWYIVYGWKERVNPAGVLVIDIRDLACCCRHSLGVFLQSYVAQLLSVSQFLLVLCYLTQEPHSKMKGLLRLPSLQAEFPRGLHQLWAWSRQMQLQALNIILPILTVCKPKYCFDSSNIIVSLEIRYCESYSLILLFEKLFKCFSPLHFHVNFGDISIKIMLFLIKVVLFIHWFLAESPS